MRVTTNTKKVFSGYFGTVVVFIEQLAVMVNGKAIEEPQHAAIRLRDTAAAMLAAADYLDTLR